MYTNALAHIHDSHFGHAAERAAPNILRVLKKAGIRSGASVAEVGCGSGIVARALADAGYDVTGFDVSPAMVRLAKAKAPRARFRVRALEDLTLSECAAVIATGEVVTYVGGGLPVLAGFFTRAHAALAPGGMLLFDFIESARGRTYATKAFHSDAWTMTVSASFDRTARVLTRRIAIVMQVGSQLSHVSETHGVRIYSRREMQSALEAAGFAAKNIRMSRSLGRYRLMQGDVVVIARKAAATSPGGRRSTARRRRERRRRSSSRSSA